MYQPGDEVLRWTDEEGFLQSKAPESLVQLDPDDPYGRPWTPVNARYQAKEPSYGSAAPAATGLASRKVPHGVCLTRNHEVVAIAILGAYRFSR